jgi:hypothetical protein
MQRNNEQFSESCRQVNNGFAFVACLQVNNGFAGK